MPQNQKKKVAKPQEASDEDMETEDARPSRTSKTKLLNNRTWVKGYLKDDEPVANTSKDKKKITGNSGQSHKRAGSDLKNSQNELIIPSSKKLKLTVVPAKKPAVNQNRKYQAPAINVDELGETEDKREERNFQKPVNKAGSNNLALKVTKSRSSSDRDDNAREDEETNEDEEVEREEEIVEPRDDPADLFAEGVVFKDGRQPADPVIRGPQSRHSRSSSIASGFRTGPPTTDDEMRGLAEEDEEEEEEEEKVVQPAKKRYIYVEKKLAKEVSRPVIMRGTAEEDEEEDEKAVQPDKKRYVYVEKKLAKERPVITTKYKTSKARVQLSDSDSEELSRWLPHTALVLNDSGSNVRVNLKQQSAEIKAVLRRGIDIADLYIVFGAPSDRSPNEDTLVRMKTPFTTSGLQYLVHLALIDAADELGYNNDGDIVERLQNGSLDDYIKPLRGHVLHRTSATQKEIRSKIAGALPTILKNTLGIDPTDQSAIAQLLDKHNYMYPCNDGDYLYYRPFQGDLIRESIIIGFFGTSNTSTRFAQMFTSSNEELPHELEVPDHMVALACTIVHASLQGLLMGGVFLPDSQFESVFKGHMAVITFYRGRSRTAYHKRMHVMYQAVTGTAGIGSAQTAQKMTATVDWDRIEESD